MTTLMTTSRTALGGLLALALLPALWLSDAMAQHCTDEATNLIAEQDIEASDVNVCNDETTLTVTYEATYPWCLLETHLHVATIPMLPPQDPDIAPIDTNIPQTNKGNPIPGQFDHGDEHGCEGVATFEIPLDDIGEDGVQPGDTVVIAAHAEVRNTETFEEEEAWGDGARFVERGPRATYFTYEVQTCGGGTSKCVFVTNEIFADGNLGGLAAADAFCQNFAEGSLAAPGTYKAWLSTSLEWPADGTRFSQASVRYKLVNGTTIANDWDDLVDGSLDAGIDVTQSGVELPPSFENWVWTGTLVSGDPSGQDCDGWLSDSSSEMGNVGLAGTDGFQWTDLPVTITTCDASEVRLYCFQQ